MRLVRFVEAAHVIEGCALGKYPADLRWSPAGWHHSLKRPPGADVKEVPPD
jgi:hypothetical protein